MMPAAQAALRATRGAYAAQSFEVGQALVDLATAYDRYGTPQEAEATWREALEAAVSAYSPEDLRLARVRVQAAAALARTGHYAAARKMALAAYARLAAAEDTSDFGVTWAAGFVARTLEACGDTAEAARYRALASPAYR